MSGLPVTFRVTYARYGELRDDIAQQMARGGLLVKVHDAPELGFDSPVALELVLPDGTTLQTAGRVLQVFSGFGIAISVDAHLVEEVGRLASRPEVAGSGAARHERIDAGSRPATRPPAVRTSASSRSSQLAARSSPAIAPPPLAAHSSPAIAPPPLAARSSPAITPPAPGARASSSIAPLSAPTSRARASSSIAPLSSTTPTPPTGSPPAGGSAPDVWARPDGPSRLEKVQIALHGSRDERNAILRDRDRTLYPFVLKNPQLDADDVVTIAKNPHMTSDMLQQIGERRDWFQRPSVALALARNPRTPAELAVRALEHVPIEALRQLAKGSGALPHVAQAARKKLLG